MILATIAMLTTKLCLLLLWAQAQMPGLVQAQPQAATLTAGQGRTGQVLAPVIGASPTGGSPQPFQGFRNPLPPHQLALALGCPHLTGPQRGLKGAVALVMAQETVSESAAEMGHETLGSGDIPHLHGLPGLPLGLLRTAPCAAQVCQMQILPEQFLAVNQSNSQNLVQWPVGKLSMLVAVEQPVSCVRHRSD